MEKCSERPNAIAFADGKRCVEIDIDLESGFTGTTLPKDSLPSSFKPNLPLDFYGKGKLRFSLTSDGAWGFDPYIAAGGGLNLLGTGDQNSSNYVVATFNTEAGVTLSGTVSQGTGRSLSIPMANIFVELIGEAHPTEKAYGVWNTPGEDRSTNDFDVWNVNIGGTVFPMNIFGVSRGAANWLERAVPGIRGGLTLGNVNGTVNASAFGALLFAF